MSAVSTIDFGQIFVLCVPARRGSARSAATWRRT